jgi:hypothetical protein
LLAWMQRMKMLLVCMIFSAGGDKTESLLFMP